MLCHPVEKCSLFSVLVQDEKLFVFIFIMTTNLEAALRNFLHLYFVDSRRLNFYIIPPSRNVGCFWGFQLFKGTSIKCMSPLKMTFDFHNYTLSPTKKVFVVFIKGNLGNSHIFI